MSEQLFWIGGVYRNGYGHIFHLDEPGESEGTASAWMPVIGARFLGFFNLRDGSLSGCGLNANLLPGELTFNGSEWVPVEKDEPDDGHINCIRAMAKSFRSLARKELRETHIPAKPLSERQHPRLTWADTKPFGRFPGFTVTKGSTDPQPNTGHINGFNSPDQTDTGHQVYFRHGSAAL